jgi:hypothetical protein
LIKLKNLPHSSTNAHIQELFRLVEEEESPFVIASKGRVALTEIVKLNPEWARYQPFITKTLSVRIL